MEEKEYEDIGIIGHLLSDLERKKLNDVITKIKDTRYGIQEKTFYTYFIFNEKANAIKIGKTTNIA